MKLHAKTGIAMGALLALAVPTAQASTGIDTGFYAGASVGLSNLSGKQDFVARDMAPPTAVLDQRTFPISSTSFAGAILGGYGYRVNCYWLAGEVSYLFDRVDSKQTGIPGGFPSPLIWKARSTGAFGGYAHFGYIPHESYVIYGIAGLEFRRFQASFQDTNNPIQFVPQISKKYSSMAFVPGVGVLVKLAQNVSLKGEYKYAFHRSKTLAFTGVIPGGDTHSATLKTSPRVQTFQVGVVYSF